MQVTLKKLPLYEAAQWDGKAHRLPSWAAARASVSKTRAGPMLVVRNGAAELKAALGKNAAIASKGDWLLLGEDNAVIAMSAATFEANYAAVPPGEPQGGTGAPAGAGKEPSPAPAALPEKAVP